MKVACAGICFLVLVVGLSVADDGKPCEMKVTSVNILCQDKVYTDDVAMAFTEEGTKLIFNSKGTVKKELPADAVCEANFYKMTDEGWKKGSFAIDPTPCCDLVKENEVYVKLAEKHNVPKECPVKEGSYSVDKWEYDYAPKCEKTPRGEFKAEFTSKHSSGECLFSYEVVVKVTDKA
ncbi:hypothetical protein C0J52_02534 [Blattella germanica]|nr:hypothetical protein C0J52_02534 [Blattella germanica]